MAARNLLIPFRRDRKRDLATGEGDALLESKVRQVLLTEGAMTNSSGELPWRTNFGAGLALLRHRSNDMILAELVRVRAREALARWMPGSVVELEVTGGAGSLALRVLLRETSKPVELSIR